MIACIKMNARPNNAFLILSNVFKIYLIAYSYNIKLIILLININLA